MEMAAILFVANLRIKIPKLRSVYKQMFLNRQIAFNHLPNLFNMKCLNEGPKFSKMAAFCFVANLRINIPKSCLVNIVFSEFRSRKLF